MAQAPLTDQTDLYSMRAIIDAEANILQGMADLFCNHLVEKIQEVIPAADAENPTAEEVQKQVSYLKRILCGYTAKESAIAEVIAAATKKDAADLGFSPEVICKCLACECKRDC